MAAISAALRRPAVNRESSARVEEKSWYLTQRIHPLAHELGAHCANIRIINREHYDRDSPHFGFSMQVVATPFKVSSPIVFSGVK